MELYHEIKDEAYVVILAGVLDGANSGEIGVTLKKAIHSRKDKIIVDCHKLTYISSSGIGIFLANLPEIKESGCDLVFDGLNPASKKVFKVLGLDNLITLTDNQPEY